MKKFLFILLTALSFGTLYGQEAMPADLMGGLSGYVPAAEAGIRKETTAFDYRQTPEWKRYKTLKICGWTALGVSMPMMTGAIFGSSFGGDDFIFRALWYTGVGMTIAGIPTLTFAYLNRHDAKREASFSSTGHRKRYITQNVLGGVSLLAGSTLFLSNCIAILEWDWDCNKGEAVRLIAGGSLILASVPLFIAAHHNKGKAPRVSLGADYIVTPSIGGGSRKDMQPALALRFNF